MEIEMTGLKIETFVGSYGGQSGELAALEFVDLQGAGIFGFGGRGRVAGAMRCTVALLGWL
jgi:hypothetical protein